MCALLLYCLRLRTTTVCLVRVYSNHKHFELTPMSGDLIPATYGSASNLYGAGTQTLLAHNSICATHSLSAARWTDSLRCLECNNQSLTMWLSTLLHYRIKAGGRSCSAHQCAHSRPMYTSPVRLPSYSITAKHTPTSTSPISTQFYRSMETSPTTELLIAFEPSQCLPSFAWFTLDSQASPTPHQRRGRFYPAPLAKTTHPKPQQLNLP
jgi:hypothetical protein